MASLYSLKAGFQKLLRPVAARAAGAGITANQVTVCAGLLSLALGVLLSWPHAPVRWFLLLPPVLLIRMALNALDGMLARDFGQKTVLGTYLNELGDVASDAFLYLPFAFVPGFDPLGVGAAIVLAALTEMTGAMGPLAGAGRHYEGPMGKSDRALVFGALGFWVGLGWHIDPWIARAFLAAMTILLASTIVNRVRRGVAEAAMR